MATDYTYTVEDSVGITDKMRRTSFVAPVYCTVAEVCEFLQVDLPDPGPGAFSWSYISNTIKRQEDKIDKTTFRSWRPRFSLNEYHDYSLYGFSLRHRPIRRVIKVELWQNGWLTLVHGRDMDQGQYWVDNRLGIIHFVGNIWYPWGHMKYRMRKFPQYQRAFRISYIWGDYMEDDQDTGELASEWAGMVKELAIKLTCIQIVNSADYTKVFPSGTDWVSLPEKAEIWERNTNEMLEELKALIIL